MAAEIGKASKRSAAKGKRVSTARASKIPPDEEGSTPGFRPYHVLSVPRGPLPVAKFVEGTPPTTVMLRNIPNRYMQSSLLEEIDGEGFTDTYDFFYLPMDVRTRANVGYAFINFLDPADLDLFSAKFTNYVFKKHPSMKIAKVSPAHIQGLMENLCHLANRAVTWSWHSQYRPIVKIQGKLKDLGELFTEYPELQASSCMASCPPAAVAPEPRTGPGRAFNPEAQEFVPGRMQQAPSLNPSASVFVPQAAGRVPQEVRSSALVEPPPGLDLPPGLELPMGELPMGRELPEARRTLPEARRTPPVRETEVEGFVLAKLGLEEAVSKWLQAQDVKRGHDKKPSVGDASTSTRSSSNNSTTRSRGACAAEEGEPGASEAIHHQNDGASEVVKSSQPRDPVLLAVEAC